MLYLESAPRGRRRRDHTQLLEKTERVDQNAAVSHFSGFKSIDHDPLHLDGLARCKNTEEGVAMRSRPGEARNDLFSFRDRLGDLPMHIREGSSHVGYDLNQAFPSLLLTGEGI